MLTFKPILISKKPENLQKSFEKRMSMANLLKTEK